MPPPSRSWLRRYGMAVACTVVAVLARWLLDPILGDSLPLATLFGAVAIAIWYGGLRPALLTVLLGYLVSDYLFIEPRKVLAFKGTAELVGLVAYLFSCFIIILIGEALHSARRRAEADAREVVQQREHFQSRLEQQVRERTAALSASEEHFRLLVEGTKDYAIFMLDPAGRVISWNPGAARIKGYQADEIIGWHFSRFYPSEGVQAGKPQRELEIAAREGKYEEEGWRVRKDGSQFWASVLITALYDETGKLRGFGKVTRDQTQKKHAEENTRRLIAEQAAREEAERTAEVVRAQREQLRVTLVSIGDAVIATDPAGKVTLLNPVAQALTGWSQEDAAGQALETVFPIHNEQTGQPAENPVARVLREGIVVGLANHSVLTARDGTARPIDDSAAPILDAAGAIVGTVLIFRDVTERRRAEQTVRFLADASAALAALVDYESTLQKVASLAVPFFADWCAVDMAQPDGSLRRLVIAHADPSRVELAHALHRRFPPDPDAPRGVGKILRTGQAELIAEVTDALLAETVQDEELLGIIRELGLKSYMGVPLHARGETIGVITFVAAESGRRYNAADLAVAEDLAHRASTAIDNARLYSEVREADRRKDEFLAMLAHEMRNPLAPIRNALHILRQPGVDAAVVERVREMMERQVLHMTRMVDDLLDVSRITRGKIELRKEVVDLASVVNRTVEALRPLIEDRRQELTVDLPPEPVRLEADPTRLEQVLANLLTNAAKYTDQEGHIHLFAQQQGGVLVLRVRDTGMGLAPDMLSRIFEPFVQSGRVLHRSQGGLGIGLTLVRSLVEMHGGTVQAHSDGLGKGSEFVVRLPILSEQQHIVGGRPAGGPSAPARAAPKRRILVVDDNVDAAESLALLLRLEGHDVWVAHDGPAALTAVNANAPDIVFLDIGMPVMNGYEVAQRLRQRPGVNNVLLVAMTGWGQEEDRRRSQEAGFDRHLVKPVEPEALQQLLAALPGS